MLKAYDSIESNYLSNGVVDKDIFFIEKQLAFEFVKQHPADHHTEICPICNSKELKKFAELNGALYWRCLGCFSIFTPADNELIELYRNYSAIKEFRSSAQFQQCASEKRALIWNDLIFWIRFRCKRYLNRNTNLDIIDVGNPFIYLSQIIKKSKLCKNYEMISSPFAINPNISKADVVLYLDQFPLECRPLEVLKSLKEMMRDDGLFVFSTRVGSGFDILTLKEKIQNIIPYDHTILPSIRGLELLFNKSGFEIMEILTPGTLDTKYVYDNLARLDDDNLYMQYLFYNSDPSILSEFQTFLQKSGTSSYARIIARKKNTTEGAVL